MSDNKSQLEKHKEAMQYAQDAIVAQNKGDKELAITLFNRAYQTEREVIALLSNEDILTKGILMRSAASLAIDCEKYEEADELILRALNIKPPYEILQELRELQTTIWRLISNKFVDINSTPTVSKKTDGQNDRIESDDTRTTTIEKPFNNFDELIIRGFRGGSSSKRKSEQQLFSAYSYFVKDGIRKFRLSEEQAFDAYSEAILNAIMKLEGGYFEGQSSLKTWIYKLFCNKCIDMVRKMARKSTNKKTTPLSISNLPIVDSSSNIAKRLSENADWDSLNDKLSHMGDSCRQLLILSAEGYSDKEISVQLGYKTPDVVKTSRLRCLEKLRKLYNT